MKKNENLNKVWEMFLRLKNQWNEEPKAVPQVIYRKGKLLGFNLLDTAVSAYAGQAAFMMILSFFPFTMFMLVLLQRLPLSPELLITAVEAFLPESFRKFMADIINGIYTTQTSSLLPVTVIAALWLGSKSFLSIIYGLNSVYKIPETRGYFTLRLWAMIYTLLFALLIIATLVLLVFGNQLFLNGRQLLEGNLHTHIAARHHDAVARGAYFLDIVHAGLVLDFGYQINIGTAVRLHKLADIQQILLAGDKGTGNIIHAVLDAEGKIALVLLVEIHLPEHLAGKAHALAVGQFSADQNGEVDIRPLDLFHAEAEQSVTKQDGVPRFQLVRQLPVIDRDLRIVPHHVVSREGEAVPVLQRHLAVPERLDSVLRSLSVQQNGYGQSQLFTYLAYHDDTA